MLSPKKSRYRVKHEENNDAFQLIFKVVVGIMLLLGSISLFGSFFDSIDSTTEIEEVQLSPAEQEMIFHSHTDDLQWTKYKYCPVCGKATLEKGIIDHELIPICSSCHFEFWEARTPRPNVNLIILDPTQEKILIGVLAVRLAWPMKK